MYVIVNALSCIYLAHRPTTWSERNWLKVSDKYNRLKKPNWQETVYKPDRRLELEIAEKQFQLSYGQNGAWTRDLRFWSPTPACPLDHAVLACVVGGISRASGFILVAKPLTRVAKPWEDWRRVELNSKLANSLELASPASEHGGSAVRLLTNPASYVG